MTSPWLSVLMPTYNGADYLSDALDSVVAENDPDIECIVVDDGSTDETLAILERYRDRLNLTIRARPRVGNWVANTNVALGEAAGEFCCLLHQDDIWLPGRLNLLRDAVARHSDVDLFLHPAWFIDSGGRRLGKWRCPLPADPAVLDAEIVLPRLLVQNFIAIPSPLFRTLSARGVGGLDDALWYTADWDFWLKMAAGAKAVYVQEPLAGFRIHTSSQTNRRSFDIDGFRRQQEVVLERHLQAVANPSDRLVAATPARLSIVLNTILAARYHGRNASLAALIPLLATLSPAAWARYYRFSRIGERVSARLRMVRA